MTPEESEEQLRKNPTFQKLLKDIKDQIWRFMDGTNASALRERGVLYDYSLGVSIPLLRLVAKDYKPSKTLARVLLTQKLREARLLGLMLFPIESFSLEDLPWLLEQTTTDELREHLAYHLLAEQDIFSEIVDSLLSINTLEALNVAMDTASRRVVLKKHLDPKALDAIFKRIDYEEINSQMINLFLWLEQDDEAKKIFYANLKRWVDTPELNKDDVAQSILDDFPL